MINKFTSTPVELLKFYQSNKWKKIRDYIRLRDNGICCRCGGIGQQVHHKKELTLSNYQTELAVDPDNLELLCAECHNAMRASAGICRDDVMFGANGKLIKRS